MSVHVAEDYDPSTSSREPRVLVVSQRALRPFVSCCALYEMEDVISTIDDAHILELPVRDRRLRGGLGRVVGAIERRVGWRLEPDSHAERVRLDRDYEILYCHVESEHDLRALQAVQNWRERCRIAICRVEELWIRRLTDSDSLRPLRSFDFVFVGCQATASDLAAKIDVPTSYVAPATDVARFTALPRPPERVIDCLWMGRRAEKTHEALFELSLRRRDSFHYVFDSRAGNSPVYDVAEHREFLADQIRRTRYFIANYAKANLPNQTGNQQELGYRFFEGAAGGAVMVGDPPECRSFQDNFDWPGSVIRLEYNSSRITELLDELEARSDEMDELRLTNMVQSLRRHDYAHRWAEMLRFAGINPLPKLKARLDRLNAIADATEEAEASECGTGPYVPDAAQP